MKVAKPAKVTKVKKVAKPARVTRAKIVAKPAEHPKYCVMIAAAIEALNEKKGSSRYAILKYIIANYKVGDNPTAINARVKAGLKAGVKATTLKQVKGTGASGYFKLRKKKAKKPAAEHLDTFPDYIVFLCNKKYQPDTVLVDIRQGMYNSNCVICDSNSRALFGLSS